MKCDVCQSKIHNTAALKRHLSEVHNQELQKDFKCKLCGKKFLSQGYLNDHTKMHSDNKPFECPECGRKFYKKANFSKHMQTHIIKNEKDKNFKCELCEKLFYNKLSLKNHQVVHSDTKFNCQYCSHQSKFKGSLKSHVKAIHENDKKFECIPCKRTFLQKSELTKHINAFCKYSDRCKELKFKCDKCDFAYDAKEKLKVHLRTKHVIKEIVHKYCGECEKSFKKNFDLELHKLLHKEPTVECLECGKLFSNKYNLRSHHATVHEERKEMVSCDVCQLLLKKKCLKGHIRRMHSGKSKNFNCTSCSKKFLTKKELEFHLTTHVGEKSFKCPICDKGFRLRTMVGAHLPVHSSDRNFHCEICSNSYKYLMTLQRHRKKVHNLLNIPNTKS